MDKPKEDVHVKRSNSQKKTYKDFWRQRKALPQFQTEKPASLERNKTFIKPENQTADDNLAMLRAEDVKDEFLVCSICTHEFDEDTHVPRILPCLHTFCQDCLRKIIKAKSMECPLCKQNHDLPQGGITGFAKDTTRRNLIDFIKVRKRSSEILCKDCPEDQTATDFCKECYIFMCPDCTRAHKRSLASRKHAVLTIKELQNSGIDVFRRKLVCNKSGHEGQQLAFYCTSPGCETSICTACTVCDHEKNKGHQIINVQDLYKVKKEELGHLFKTLEEDMSSAKFILQQTEQELLNLDIKELEIEKDIDDVFERCQKTLLKRQRALKDQLASICEQKKSGIQRHIEIIENYLDGAANAKDFSLHVLNHTDPTEFVPLHTTLLHRLQNMSALKFDRQVLSIESPVFDNTRTESEFQVFTKSMGDISTVTQKKKLAISRGHTHIGASSASTTRQIADDKRFGDISCPSFYFDSETVHQYREISDNRRVLRNYSTVQKQGIIPGSRKLKKYRGVLASRAFHVPGKFYFEILITYNIVRPLDNINFVFEVGASRRGDIDHNYYVYDQPNAWSFCGQHCDDHKQVCIWCRHNGYNLAHLPLTPNTPGTTLARTFGFILDADRSKFSIVDVTRKRKLHTFQGVDFSHGLWPVFGCHWPSKVKLEMLLKTGRDIEKVPEFIHSI
ncbi:protein PML-like [Ruditapes philippinarum]|uniref:protein PML-like n=1 Tax=Ruditapes philippinarum TaxID=129788 RepID=UPI00295AB116|nr:protein PML-like [Ruditapes philippinarum]